eukprot:4037417-Alexandrium_andersonii.AAC.1
MPWPCDTCSHGIAGRIGARRCPFCVSRQSTTSPTHVWYWHTKSALSDCGGGTYGDLFLPKVPRER